MLLSVHRWLEALKLQFGGRLTKLKRRGKRSRCRTRRSFVTPETLEDRTLLAVDVSISADIIYVNTDANDRLKVVAEDGNLTLSSTTGLVNSIAAVDGVSSVSFPLGEFQTIQINGGSGTAIFNYVEVQGSAEFANETLNVYGATVDFTTGPLSVNGLFALTQGAGSTLLVDQPINSTGNVSLETLGANISVTAPINAAGQVVQLRAAIVDGQSWSNSQTADGVITATSVYAQASLGTDLSAAPNVVTNISGLSSTSGDFRFRSALDLTVTSVATGVGVTTTDGDVRLETAAGGLITVGDAITAGGTGHTLTLAADELDLDTANSLTAENVVLTTVGTAVDLTLGLPGLTDAELDAINATDLRLQASGTISMTTAIGLGDTVSQLITLQANAIDVATNLSGHGTTGGLRFETDSLTLNTALAQSVSASFVEIVATSDITFSTTTVTGGLDFSQSDLNALDEANVNVLRISTSGSIYLEEGGLNVNNGSVLAAGGILVLNAGGAIGQDLNSPITSASLSIVGQSVNLTHTGNQISIVSGAASGGDFLLTSANSLMIDAVDVGGRGVGASGITVALPGHRAELMASAVTQTVNGIITAPELGVAVTGAIDLQTVDNSVAVLAMATSSDGMMAFSNNSGGTLTIGTVGSLAGITAGAAGSQVFVVSNNDLSVDAAIQTAAAGNLAAVTLTSTTGSIAQASGVLLGAETMTLTAADSVSLAGRLHVGVSDAVISAQNVTLTGVLQLTLNAVNDFSLVTITAGAADLTGAELEIMGTYTPITTEVLTVVTATSLSGTFDGYPEDSALALNGKSLRVNYTTANVTLTTNVAPVLANPLSAQFANESEAFQFVVPVNTFADTDVGDNLTYAASLSDTSVLPAWLSFDPLTLTFSGTPVETDIGVIEITVTVTDSFGESAEADFLLTVQDVNFPPVAVDDAYIVDEDSSLVVDVAGVLNNDTDADEDSLTATIIDQPSHGTVSLDLDGLFVYTPEPGYVGTDSFTYQSNDGELSSNTATVTITVLNVNDFPVAIDDTFVMNENAVLSPLAVEGVLANDTDDDGDTLTATLVTGPSHGVVTVNADGSFNYVPDADFIGTDSFTYQASDGVHLSNVAKVTLTVLNVNQAPVSVNDAYTITENNTLVADGVLSNDVDVDGDELFASLDSGPIHGVLTFNPDGSFIYTPDLNFYGIDTFTYRSNDGTLDGTIGSVVITVVNVNQVPQALDDIYTVDEDEVLVGSGVLINDTDVDGDSLNAILVTGPAHGVVVLNPDGTFTYSPTENFSGTDSFTYQASDGQATGNVATVTITVNGVNDAPIAANDSFNVDEDAVLQSNLLLANDTDVDGDTLTAMLVEGPAHGTLTLNPDGSFTYTPDPDFWGTDSFTYQATDGELNSNVATVSLTVNPVDEFFIQLSSGVSSSRNGRKVLVDPSSALLAPADLDLNGATLTVSIIAGARPRDVLRLIGQGHRIGQVNAYLGKLRLGREVLGTVSGGRNGDPLQIQFNTGTTAAVIERVLRQIGFKGKKNQTGVRTVEFRLTAGDTTGVDTKDVQI